MKIIGIPRRVLIVTYYFPPRQNVASLRLRGLAKYLPEFGWHPVVLTPKLAGRGEAQYDVIETEYPGDVTDVWKKRLGLQQRRGLQEQLGISRSGPVRTGSFPGKLISVGTRLFAFPDNQKYWLSHALREGCRILTERPFAAILSSSGPVTCHLVASELTKRYRIPWVADYRDLWSQNHYQSYGTIGGVRHRRLELRTLKAAVAAVTVSRPLSDQLQSLHAGLSVHTITNGYDPDEVGTRPLTRKLTITYTGSFYRGKRDPTPLFAVLARLFEEGRMQRENVEVRLFGPMGTWLDELVQQYRLGDVVKLNPLVPRSDVLNKQRESHLLLLLNWNHPRELGVYTGKVFEYLAARRPILALGGPGGVVAELLTETRAGVHVGDEEQLRRVLISSYSEYLNKGFVSYNGEDEAISRYSHREMAKQFAKLLDRYTIPRGTE